MPNGEDGLIQIDGQAALLGVDVSLTGCIAQFGMKFCGAKEFTVEGLSVNIVYSWFVKPTERHGTAGLVLFQFQGRTDAQTTLQFVVERKTLAVIGHHLVYLRPFERHEEIVLVGRHEAVAGRTDIEGGLQRECPSWELAGQILLGIQRPDELGIVVVLMTGESVGQIALQEQVFVQVRRGLCAGTDAPAVYVVVGQQCVHRPDVHFRRAARLHMVLYQCFQSEHHVLEALDLFDMFHECRHAAFALRQLHLSVLRPEVVAPHLGIGLAHLLPFTLEQTLWQRVEGIVRQPRGADDQGLL